MACHLLHQANMILLDLLLKIPPHIHAVCFKLQNLTQLWCLVQVIPSEKLFLKRQILL